MVDFNISDFSQKVQDFISKNKIDTNNDGKISQGKELSALLAGNFDLYAGDSVKLNSTQNKVTQNKMPNPFTKYTEWYNTLSTEQRQSIVDKTFDNMNTKLNGLNNTINEQTQFSENIPSYLEKSLNNGSFEELFMNNGRYLLEQLENNNIIGKDDLINLTMIIYKAQAEAESNNEPFTEADTAKAFAKALDTIVEHKVELGNDALDEYDIARSNTINTESNLEDSVSKIIDERGFDLSAQYEIIRFISDSLKSNANEINEEFSAEFNNYKAGFENAKPVLENTVYEDIMPDYFYPESEDYGNIDKVTLETFLYTIADVKIEDEQDNTSIINNSTKDIKRSSYKTSTEIYTLRDKTVFISSFDGKLLRTEPLDESVHTHFYD